MLHSGRCVEDSSAGEPERVFHMTFSGLATLSDPLT